jgi:hypothetical protein
MKKKLKVKYQKKTKINNEDSQKLKSNSLYKYPIAKTTLKQHQFTINLKKKKEENKDLEIFGSRYFPSKKFKFELHLQNTSKSNKLYYHLMKNTLHLKDWI